MGGCAAAYRFAQGAARGESDGRNGLARGASLPARSDCQVEVLAAELVFEQVADDLGVGLGVERVAAGEQLAAKLGVVLDDAVVDDGQSTLAVQVRMGVGIGDSAVGRPARMAQRRVAGWQRRARLADLADVLFDQQSRWNRRVLARGDAPRVVAAVLELLQPSQDTLRRLFANADVAEYAAHRGGALLFCSRRRPTGDGSGTRATPTA